MKQFISQKEWLKFPKDVRQNLIFKFAINKSEGTKVIGGQVVSDGCSAQDLINGLTIGKMIEYLGNNWKKVENDALFERLLELTVNKINGNESKEHDEQDESKESDEKGATKDGAGKEDAAGTDDGGAKGKGKGSKGKGKADSRPSSV